MNGFGEKNNNRKQKKKNIIADLNSQKLISDAFKFHSQGKLNEALKIYKLLIKNGTKDPRIFINLGGIYQQSKRYEEAIPIYKYIIRNFPNSPEAYSNLGKILQEKGDFQEAVKYVH